MGSSCWWGETDFEELEGREGLGALGSRCVPACPSHRWRRTLCPQSWERVCSWETGNGCLACSAENMGGGAHVCVDWTGRTGVCAWALTVEGPQVVVPQVHQVLQGRVELLHDALDPKGKGTGRNDGQRQVIGPPEVGTPGPNEKPPEPRGVHLEPWGHPESCTGLRGLPLWSASRSGTPGQTLLTHLSW